MAKVSAEKTDVPALIITPEKAPAVSGNFEQIEKYLLTWKKDVLSLDINEENIDEVRIVKKKAVMYRNSLDAILTKTKKLYFNDPKAVFEAQMQRLLGIVGEVESAADNVLAKEEQERVDNLNEVFEHYKEKFQLAYNLEEQYLSRIEFKKNYYNKSDITVDGKKISPELAAKKDMETQFQALKKEQDAYAANVRLITATCKDELRLNVQHWIDQLQYNDVASLTEAILNEKERFRNIDREQAKEITGVETVTANSSAEVVEEDTAKVVLGIPASIDFSTDFPGRNRTIKVEISYPCDLGDAMTELFKQLKSYGIKTKVVKEETVF